MKKQLKERFEKVYGKDFRLLAIQLNGFSHSIFYDNGKATSDIMQDKISGYMSQSEKDYYGYGGKAEAVLQGIPHYTYQNNAKELIYVLPKDR